MERFQNRIKRQQTKNKWQNLLGQAIPLLLEDKFEGLLSSMKQTFLIATIINFQQQIIQFQILKNLIEALLVFLLVQSLPSLPSIPERKKNSNTFFL